MRSTQPVATPALVGVMAAAALAVTHWVAAGAAPQATQPASLATGPGAIPLPDRRLVAGLVPVELLRQLAYGMAQ